MDPAAQIKPWIDQLRADAESRRTAAIEQLMRSPHLQAAAVALVEASGDASEAVRQLASGVLEDLGPPAAADLAQLTALLSNGTEDVAYWAATLLGRLGGAAAPAAETLVSAAARDGAA
ncbi:MAG: hypothetical protein K1X74_09930, partial [Pirellulales bacterium]|nr:hypothetical protein [Pirellulales bacterium]